MLLRPSKAGVSSRLCVVGKKRLPSARRHEVSGGGGLAPGCARQQQPASLTAAAFRGMQSPRQSSTAVLCWVAVSRPPCGDAGPAARSHACLPARPCLAACLQRFFGFVEARSEDAEPLLQGLGPKTYETKTRGGWQLWVPAGMLCQAAVARQWENALLPARWWRLAAAGACPASLRLLAGLPACRHAPAGCCTGRGPGHLRRD